MAVVGGGSHQLLESLFGGMKRRLFKRMREKKRKESLKGGGSVREVRKGREIITSSAEAT
jgi:hypothetical protein